VNSDYFFPPLPKASTPPQEPIPYDQHTLWDGLREIPGPKSIAHFMKKVLDQKSDIEIIFEEQTK
jgi:hypothetical protein